MVAPNRILTKIAQTIEVSYSRNYSWKANIKICNKKICELTQKTHDEINYHYALFHKHKL